MKKIKIECHASTGGSHCEKQEVVEVEIPLNATKEEIKAITQEVYDNWLTNNVELTYKILEASQGAEEKKIATNEKATFQGLKAALLKEGWKYIGTAKENRDLLGIESLDSLYWSGHKHGGANLRVNKWLELIIYDYTQPSSMKHNEDDVLDMFFLKEMDLKGALEVIKKYKNQHKYF